MGQAKEQNGGTETFEQKKERYKNMRGKSKRRASLGVDINVFESESPSFFGQFDARYSKHGSADLLKGRHLTRADRWELLRRAKDYLSRRLVQPDQFEFLNPYFQRKHDELRGTAFPLIDYFPGLKYSYSAPLPASVVAKMRGVNLGQGSFRTDYLDVCVNSGGTSKRARISDVMRSHSIRLDPVEAPKQLFQYRLRIRRCISWAYEMRLVPIMMTLTVFHRWHPLKGLLNVLSGAWDYFFTGTRMAVRRSKKMGLAGYIRRAEETINNGVRCESGRGNYNSGWHPHYHVILFVPSENLEVVSSMEDELREAWFQAVNRCFEKEFGKPIDSAYESSFKRHGLLFSRCVGKGFRDTRGHDMSFLDKAIDGSPLRHVDDGEYLAKILGCETSSCYGGDSELSSGDAKGSRVPFDLLCDDTAENVDLWVEYAMATKGVMSFFFSRGLEKRVDEFYKQHSDKDPVKPLDKKRQVLFQIHRDTYRFLYRMFKVDEMLKVSVKGMDALTRWFRRFYIEQGFLLSQIKDDMLPQAPETRRWYVGVVDELSAHDGSKLFATDVSLVDDGDVIGVACDDDREVIDSADCREEPVVYCDDIQMSDDCQRKDSYESRDDVENVELGEKDVCVPDKGRGIFLSQGLKKDLSDSSIMRWSLRDYRYGRSAVQLDLFANRLDSASGGFVRDLDVCPFKSSVAEAIDAVLDEIDVSTDLIMEKLSDTHQFVRKQSIEGDDP